MDKTSNENICINQSKLETKSTDEELLKNDFNNISIEG